jgi:Flp pilus assembly protein TadG
MMTKWSDRGNCRWPKALWRSERGQSLIELALLTPVLLMLVIGIVEMGRYASFGILVSNAARAGAQYGAQSLTKAADNTGIASAVQNECSSADTVTCQALTLVPASGPYTICGCDNGGAFTATACTSTCTTGHMVVSVQVGAKGTFNPLFNYTPPLFGHLSIPQIIITSTATQRVAQ